MARFVEHSAHVTHKIQVTIVQAANSRPKSGLTAGEVSQTSYVIDRELEADQGGRRLLSFNFTEDIFSNTHQNQEPGQITQF
jgi:hypothetical protein